MKRFFIFMAAIFMANFSVAQFTDRYWTFGDSSAIDFRNLTNPSPANSILRSRGTCVSICDSLGALLFYASDPHVDLWLHPGTYDYGYVVNKNHQFMENGDSLKANLWYEEMVIVPDPGNNNRFYLFTCGITNTPIPGFYYSMIDLSYNGGLGRVVQKNIQLHSFPVCDGLAAIKHGNGRDWWVFFKHWNYNSPNNEFYSYLITPNGISGPFIQLIGTSQWNNLLRLKFSPDGKSLFQLSYLGLFEKFDFDRCAGLLSNAFTIQQQDTIAAVPERYWSIALSPNSDLAYLTSIYVGPNQDSSYLFQFDLTAGNILSSKDTLLGFKAPSIAGMLQLAPDNKIYLSCSMEFNPDDCDFFYLYCDTSYYPENMNISVIDQPDNLGAACNFQPFSFYLGGHRTYVGLPNNPNYELGPDTNSICDTVTVADNLQIKIKSGELYIWYNSEWQVAFINAQHLKGKRYNLQVTDLLGKVVSSEEGKLNSEFYTKNLNCSLFSSGIYIISLATERETLNRKFIIE